MNLFKQLLALRQKLRLELNYGAIIVMVTHGFSMGYRVHRVTVT